MRGPGIFAAGVERRGNRGRQEPGIWVAFGAWRRRKRGDAGGKSGREDRDIRRTAREGCVGALRAEGAVRRVTGTTAPRTPGGCGGSEGCDEDRRRPEGRGLGRAGLGAERQRHTDRCGREGWRGDPQWGGCELPREDGG